MPLPLVQLLYMSLEDKLSDNTFKLLMVKELVPPTLSVELITDFKLLIHSHKFGLPNSAYQVLEEQFLEQDGHQLPVVMELVQLQVPLLVGEPLLALMLMDSLLKMPREIMSALTLEDAQESNQLPHYLKLDKLLPGEEPHQVLEDTVSMLPHAGDDLLANQSFK